MDYLSSPTRVQPPQSDPAERAYAEPVVPSGLGVAPPAAESVCDLLPAPDVEQVTGVDDLAASPAPAVHCSYRSAGETVLRLSRHDFPRSTQPADVLATMVSSYAELEPMAGVGDAAAYVPNASGSLPPALFVAAGMDEGGVCVLRLAFGPAHLDAVDAGKHHLHELAVLAAEGL